MAAQSDSALKLSLLTGLATGISSLAVYSMMSKDKKSARGSDGDFDDTTTVTSKLDYMDEEKQDEEDVRNVVNELIREMKSVKDNEPKKTQDGTNVFTEEWTMKLLNILFKYQLISHQIIKNQQQERRLQALQNKQEKEYVKAVSEGDRRKANLTLEIEQTVFDFFGIITPEYDMSISYWNKQVLFQANKLKAQADLTNELVLKEDKPLTREQCKELHAKITEFTNKIIFSAVQVDPSTGQKVINVQDTSLEIELLKQKDWFFINEGITTEYVTKKLKEFQEKDQAEILGQKKPDQLTN